MSEQASAAKKNKKKHHSLPLIFLYSPALDTRSATVKPLGPPPAITRSTRPLEGSKDGSSRSSSAAWLSADERKNEEGEEELDVGDVGATATAETAADFDGLPGAFRNTRVTIR